MFPTDWLAEKISERRHIPEYEMSVSCDTPSAAKPFGFDSDKGKSLKAAMKPADELWAFCAPTEVLEKSCWSPRRCSAPGWHSNRQSRYPHELKLAACVLMCLQASRDS